MRGHYTYNFVPCQNFDSMRIILYSLCRKQGTAGDCTMTMDTKVRLLVAARRLGFITCLFGIVGVLISVLMNRTGSIDFMYFITFVSWAFVAIGSSLTIYTFWWISHRWRHIPRLIHLKYSL